MLRPPSNSGVLFYKGFFMAERRMFARTIVTSDDFLDMPMSARCLYFTLGMFADDDGFVNSPKSIMRQVGASNDDMNLLIAKKYLIIFENGVIVIKHWRIHNYIRNDRYNETKYLKQKQTLFLEENKAYTQNRDSAKYDVYGVLLEDKEDMVYQRYPQDRIGKDRLELDNNIANKESNNTYFNSININEEDLPDFLK